jgi:undecaprenyl-diphosphatase
VTAGRALWHGVAPWCRPRVVARLAVGWAVLVAATTVAGVLLVPAPSSAVGGFDAAIVENVAEMRTEVTARVVLVVTQLAALELAIPLIVLLGLFDGLRRGRWETLVLPAVTVGGGLALSVAVKFLTWRDRPDEDLAVIDALGPAFPSGHVIRAVALAATFSWLLIRAVPRARPVWIATAAGVAVATVALARIYLGAHWPSDVLVALVASGAWTAWVLSWVPAVGRDEGVAGGPSRRVATRSTPDAG